MKIRRGVLHDREFFASFCSNDGVLRLNGRRPFFVGAVRAGSGHACSAFRDSSRPHRTADPDARALRAWPLGRALFSSVCRSLCRPIL